MLGLTGNELRNIDQELKEAVCDALTNLTIETVSGMSPASTYLYGSTPRRSIVSGQLLPRFDESGQNDDSSDIRIAALGLDFQIGRESVGQARVAPRFSVYVRVLPTWDEINGGREELELNFRLRTSVQDQIDQRSRQLRQQRFIEAGVATPDWPNLNPSQRLNVRETRDQILSEIRQLAYGEQGITLSDTADEWQENNLDVDDAESGNEKSGDEEQSDSSGAGMIDSRLRIGHMIQQGRQIPFSLLEDARLPGKWRRIDLQVPPIEWSLISDVQALSTQLVDYNKALRASALQQVLQWLRSDEGRLEAWRDLRIRPDDCVSSDAWNSFRQRTAELPVPEADLLPKLDDLQLQIDRIDDYTDATRASIRIVLDNRTAQSTRREALTRTDTIFGVSLEVRIPENEHRFLRLDRVEPSYRFRHFLNYPAIGLNCGVESSMADGTLILRTTWAPKFVQPRIVARSISAPVTYAELSSESLGISDLLVLSEEYKRWIDAEESRLRNSVREGLSQEDADRESRRLESDISAQRAEAGYIERGISLLIKSQQAYTALADNKNDSNAEALARRAAPYRAWLLTNRSFLEREGGNTGSGWRLFQLAFILAHVPTLASRMEEFREYQDSKLDEDTASLLYFPTGGGKSEAFYGTLIFGMFLDRLRGKDRGVTAMIRYPLRLLTLQQGQRLLKLVAYAELVRTREHIGSWPFEIGFWVGSANTPNSYYPAPSAVPLVGDTEYSDDENLDEDSDSLDADARERAHRYSNYCAAYNKVPDCPVCGEPTGLRRFENEGATAKRLGIVCFNAECRWNTGHSSVHHLPFLLTDDAIYARAPSIVLGTIDKMAMLGQHTSTIRKLLGMFGMARGIGPSGHLCTPRLEGVIDSNFESNGYAPVYPAFRAGRHVFNDPFPSLIIQDEAHLLEESLGTFSGLFDSALECVFQDIYAVAGSDLSVSRIWKGDDWAGPRMPKVIAATATISNPDRQLEVLYQREPLRFPSPGPDIYHSFFSEPAPAPDINAARVALEEQLPEFESPEKTSPWMRLFVSLMTNDATHTVTAVAVLSAFHGIITKLWRDLQSETSSAGAIESLKRCQSPGLSEQWRRDALSRAETEGREREILALIDLHRVSLMYVTNKKGGDQVMDALDAAIRQRHAANGEPLSSFMSRLISGGVDMKEIQNVMTLAETDNAGAPYPDVSDRLRSIVATSAISHGVDVDRFNSMFFAGLPSDIAEYIQASSRVGRAHVGFVMLIPTPQSRRDRYVVETHDIFHRFLERMIAPPAVERWAENAIRRVLASFVQTWAILRENTEFVSRSDDQKGTSLSFETVANISALAKRDQVAFINDLQHFILRAIGHGGRGANGLGRPVYQEHYRRLIDSEISRFAQNMREISTAIRLSDYWNDSGVFRSPMTSLRDVDEAGIITAGAFDAKARDGRRRVDTEDLIHVMRAIRSQRGVVAETDADDAQGGA